MVGSENNTAAGSAAAACAQQGPATHEVPIRIEQARNIGVPGQSAPTGKVSSPEVERHFVIQVREQTDYASLPSQLRPHTDRAKLVPPQAKLDERNNSWVEQPCKLWLTRKVTVGCTQIAAVVL